MNPETKQDILTTKEAAQFLKVTVQTIKNYIYKGRLRSFKTPGGHHRILLIDLLNLRRHPTKEESSLLPATLEQSQLSFLKSLLSLIEEKDTFSPGHSQRVARLSAQILKQLDGPEEEIEAIELAALLHDIGKIRIDEKILAKPGRLSREESLIIKKHPLFGEEIVKIFSGMLATASTIRHHHEWFDGRGYPDGLSKEKIPLGSRIIALAEAFDSLTSWATYRKAQSPKVAIRIIKKAKATQFDPQVVEAFLKITF